MYFCASAAPSSAAYANWDWSTGDWNDGSRWSSDPDYPNNGGSSWSVEVSAGTINRTISPTISSLDFSGGTIRGTGALTVTGSTSWSGGTFQVGNVNFNGGASITGNVMVSDSAATLTLASLQTVNITGSGKLTLDNGAKLVNNGTLRARNDQKIGASGSFQTSFTNNGTFIRDTGTGTFVVETPAAVNHGTVEVNTGTLEFLRGLDNDGNIHVASGATLKLSSASIMSAGTSFTGTGALVFSNDEIYMHPTITIPNRVTLEASGKISIHDGHTLTFGDAFTWSGLISRESLFAGGLHGYCVVNGGATIHDNAHLLDVTVTNPATAIASLASSAAMYLEKNAVIVNAGTFSLGAGSSVNDADVDGDVNEWINSGSLVANGSSLQSVSMTLALTNTGTVTATAGTLYLSGSGSSSGVFQAASGAKIQWSQGYEFGAGTTFIGAGSFALGAGDFSLVDSISTSANFSISGTLDIPHAESFAHHGALECTGAKLIGGGTLVAHSDLEITSAEVTDSILLNESGSQATHDTIYGSAYVILHSGGILRNEGDFTAVNAQGIAAGLGSGNRFENSGTFLLEPSDYVPGILGTYTISSELLNTGSMDVAMGKLVVVGGGSSTGGSWSVAADALVEMAENFTFSGTNTVTGAGDWIFGNEAGTGSAVHTLGGTLTLGAPVTLNHASLVIDSGATVTATESFDAIYGSISGAGVFHANGGTNLGEITVDGATLALGAGSTNHHASSEAIILNNDASLSNAGTFYARGDFDYLAGASAMKSSSGVASFSNSGTWIRDTGILSYPIAVPFHNSGTVSTQSGSLLLTKGGSSTNGTWDNVGGALYLFENFTFDGTTTITGNYVAALYPGIYTVNGPLTSTPGLALEGAVDLAVQPMQTVTVNGLFTLTEDFTSAPKISGGGTVEVNAQMSLRTGIIDGSTLHLALGQTANHTAAQSLVLMNGGLFHNDGTYWAGVEGSITQDATLGNLFRNSGTFKQDGSTGIFTVSAPFENSGTIDAITGTILFSGEVNSTGTVNSALTGKAEFSGNSSFNHATPFTGVGAVALSAGTHGFVQSSVSTVDLTISGGVVNVPVDITLDSTGLTHWSGGSIAGTGTLLATGGLDLSGAVNLVDSTLSIPATKEAVQTSLGNLTLDGNAVLNNAGTWHAANALSISGGLAGTHAVMNSGLFLRDTDAGTFVVAVPFHNSGTVGVSSGILSLQGNGSSTGEFNVIADTDLSLSGSNIFSGDSSFTGAGRINLQSGIQQIENSMPSSAVVNLTGATLQIDASQKFQSDGTFHWVQGLVTGGGTLETSGALDLASGARTIDGATLTSTAIGSISFADTGSLILNNNAVMENLGTTLLLNDGQITTADSSVVAFHNAGTITRDISLGNFSIGVPFYHTGILHLNSGSISFNGGGTASDSIIHTQAGTALYIGANYTFGPDNVITGAGITHFSNGSLHVTGDLTTDGSFQWSGGTLDGGGIFTVKGGLSIAPVSQPVYIDGSTLENASGSEAVISGSAATHILNGGTYRNSGLTRLQGNNNFYDGGGGANSIVNAGTMIRDAGTGSYTVSLPLHNSGTLRSSSGALLLNAGGSITAGVLEADGGDMYFNGGSFQLAGGALTGANWVYLTTGTANITSQTGAATGLATGGFGIAGNSAVVTGTATLSVDHGYFGNGQMNGATIRITGASTKIANSHLSMNGGIIRNEGTWTNESSGNIDFDNDVSEGAGTIENIGIWSSSESFNYLNTYGAGSFDNHGTFHSSNGYSNIYAAVHHHAGSIFRATAGYVLLRGGGTVEAGATLDADGAGDLHFYGGTHTLEGGAITGANHVYASIGTANIVGNVGALTGPATGGFGIAGNTAVVTGTATLSVDHGYFGYGQMNGATIRITGASTKIANSHLSMNGGIIRNEGTWTNQLSGNIDFDNDVSEGAGTVENHGTWNSNETFTYSNTYGAGSFHNYGTFASTSGYSHILASVHHHTGSIFRSTGGYVLLRGGGTVEAGATLDADGAGDIHFYGGTHTLEGGTITGVNHVYASIGTSNIVGNVGALTGAATGGFGIAGTSAVVTGTATLSVDHGYFGNGQINGATIRITGASTKIANSHLGMNGGIIRNEGIWTNQLSGNIDFDNDGSEGAGMIENRGTWNSNETFTYYNTYGTGSFHNHGTFHSSGGYSHILAAVHHHTGSIFRATDGYVLLRGGGTVEAGATLDADGAGDLYFYGGTHTVEGGTITGVNHVYASIGTTNIVGNVGAVTGPATGGFGIAGNSAVVTGTATLSVDHGYFGNGQMTGATIRITGASTKDTNTHLGMGGGTIRNEGIWTNRLSGNIDFDIDPGEGAGTIENIGTWNSNETFTYYNTYGAGSFHNHGTFHSSGGFSHILAAIHHHAGSTFRSTGGYVLLRGGGTVEEGATLDADGAGSLEFYGGTHTLYGGTITGSNFVYATIGTVNIVGNVGALTGPATGGFGIAGNYALVTGTATLSVDHGYFGNSQMTGATIRVTGASTKDANSHLSMNGGTIRNEGTMTSLVSGNFDLDYAPDGAMGTIENIGSWNITDSMICYNTYGSGVVDNRGAMTVENGNSIFYAHLQNSGSLTISAGTLTLQQGSTHSGSIVANGGINFGSGTHGIAGSVSYLGGTGYSTGSLSLSDGASIRPGNSAGNLTNYGSWTFVSGGNHPSVVIELNSNTSFDTITLANGSSLQLDTGLTDLIVQPSYQPTVGTAFRIVTADSSTGTVAGKFRNASATGSVLTTSFGAIPLHFRVVYDSAGKYIDLVTLSPYQAWAYNKGLDGADVAFDADPDHDGISNGIEFVIDGEPNPVHPNAPSQALLPQIVLDETYLRVLWRRSVASLYLNPAVEYDANLVDAWTTATHGVDGVIINVTSDGYAAGVDKIETLIPRTHAEAGKLFTRLKVTEP